MKKLALTVMVLIGTAMGTGHAATTWFKGYRFEAGVLTHRRGILREHYQHSRHFIYVKQGDEYSIIIKNPLPVRVAVAVTVDGLNTIDGKRTSPGKARKWIIGPYSSMTLRGWQTSTRSLRRFVFTREKYSYAKWKERSDGKHYTQNLGVIGVAYFWNSHELYRALNPPHPFTDEGSCGEELAGRSRRKAAGKACPPSSRAGTGMGRQQYHRVQRVKFHYDTGMYASRQVLKIFYRFNPMCTPNPFGDGDNGFAPDMYHLPKRHSKTCRPLSLTQRMIIHAKIRNLQMVLYQYHADQGRYPDSLQELVTEKYLWQIPDPFSGRWLYNKNSGKVKHSLI